VGIHQGSTSCQTGSPLLKGNWAGLSAKMAKIQVSPSHDTPQASLAHKRLQPSGAPPAVTVTPVDEPRLGQKKRRCLQAGPGAMCASASGPQKPHLEHFSKHGHCSHEWVLIDPMIFRPHSQTYPHQFATGPEASLHPTAQGRSPTPTQTGPITQVPRKGRRGRRPRLLRGLRSFQLSHFLSTPMECTRPLLPSRGDQTHLCYRRDLFVPRGAPPRFRLLTPLRGNARLPTCAYTLHLISDV